MTREQAAAAAAQDAWAEGAGPREAVRSRGALPGTARSWHGAEQRAPSAPAPAAAETRPATAALLNGIIHY